MSDRNALLEMRNIEKSFAGVTVLKSANFTLKKGEVHALMGGNGAGKSTLMKILTGVYTRDAGSIHIDGNPVDITSPKSARENGIAMIFQEFSLVNTLSVAQNIYLNREPRKGGLLSDSLAIEQSREILRELEVDIDPSTTVANLSVGYCQMVEIAKAISQNARILVMDEPTASLSEREAQSLFKLVHKLKRKGISVIYISHRMAEVFDLCDRVTVMRDGNITLTSACGDVSIETLVENMLGAAPASSFEWHDRGHIPTGEPTLSVRNLTIPPRLNDVSLDVYAGEIVGLAGLMGSGRTEIAEAIFGRREIDEGEISVLNQPIKSQSDALKNGVALVPEDRRTLGLVLEHSVGENLLLPNLRLVSQVGRVDDRKANSLIDKIIEQLSIKTDNRRKTARLLSGGNQQKIVLGKWLAQLPNLLILDEPTIGVDIGAKSEIVRIIRKMADQGVAVLVISSELEELLAISDRILVLHGGKIIQQLQRKEVRSEEELHHAIQGHKLNQIAS